MRKLNHSHLVQEYIALKRNSRISTSLILTIIILLSGCSDGDKSGKLERRIAVLESKSLEEHENDVAWVSPEAATEYSTVKTKWGTFIVVCNGVTPYLDGYKVGLSIGNITTATFLGAKIVVGWGDNPDKDIVDPFLNIHGSRYTKEFDVTTQFDPGQYSHTEVVLTPAKPEDIKRIGVRPSFDVIRLR